MKKLLLAILLFIPLTCWFVLTFSAIILEKIVGLISMGANIIENKLK